MTFLSAKKKTRLYICYIYNINIYTHIDRFSIVIQQIFYLMLLDMNIWKNP